MAVYRITIEPTDDSAAPAATTIVSVEIDGPHPRVLSLTLRPSAANGLTDAPLRLPDLSAILTALQSNLNVVENPRRDGAVRPQPAQRPTAQMRESLRSPSRTMNLSPVPPTSQSTDSEDVAVTSAGRAYRKMPAADSLREVFGQIGTVTGLAKYYGVPRHTAQGWMTRLRKIDAAAAKSSS